MNYLIMLLFVSCIYDYAKAVDEEFIEHPKREDPVFREYQESKVINIITHKLWRYTTSLLGQKISESATITLPNNYTQLKPVKCGNDRYQFIHPNRLAELKAEHDIVSKQKKKEGGRITLLADVPTEKIIEPPYKFIGSMLTTFPNAANTSGKGYVMGSGVLIGPNHVLTAGHNIYDKKFGGWAESIIFTPAQDLTDTPFSDAKGRIFKIFPKWREEENDEYDIGIVILDKPIGLTVGWASLLYVEDLRNNIKCLSSVIIAGYPRRIENRYEVAVAVVEDKDKSEVRISSAKMFKHQGKVIEVQERRLSYEIVTTNGQSGSPILASILGLDNNFYILGIHSHYLPTATNHGTYITSDYFDLIVKEVNKFMLPESTGLLDVLSNSERIIKTTLTEPQEIEKLETEIKKLTKKIKMKEKMKGLAVNLMNTDSEIEEDYIQQKSEKIKKSYEELRNYHDHYFYLTHQRHHLWDSFEESLQKNLPFLLAVSKDEEKEVDRLLFNVAVKESSSIDHVKEPVVDHVTDLITKLSIDHPKVSYLGDRVDRRTLLNEDIRSRKYQFNCYLEIYYANVDGQAMIYYGSGILIAPNLILTAGYNLYDVQHGGYPDRIDCFVAALRHTCLAEATVFPKSDNKSIYIHPKYIRKQEHYYDVSVDSDLAKCIGLIIFKDDRFKSLSYAVPAAIKEDTLENIIGRKKRVVITGYPGRRQAYTMRGNLVPPTNKQKICYDIDTSPGQGGAGICLENRGEDRIYCIGVHFGKDKEDRDAQYKVGTLIDKHMLEAIRHFATRGLD